MRKAILLLIALLGIMFIPSLASANAPPITGKPGMQIPLVLNNYQITTDTLLLPDWKPSSVKWSLISPSGQVTYLVNSGLDSVTQAGGGIPIFGSTTWSITEDSGNIKIPAFAETGTWTLNAKFYDRALFIFYNSEGVDVETINIQSGGIVDNLNAPLTYAFNIPLTDSSYTIAFDLIYIIAFIIIVPLIFLIWFTLIRGRRK